jgi:hypothetical protein
MAEDREKQKPKKKRRAPQFNPADNPRRKIAPEDREPIELQASFEPGAKGPRLAPRAASRHPGPEAGPEDKAEVPDPVRLPPVTDVRCFNTTRLLPAKYSESVLTRIAASDRDLPLIFALEHATNDRLLSEANLRLGITARELVFEVPYSRIINAAFTHPHPQGGRFSTPYRGAWYAGLDLATAKAEVLFHRAIQFTEIAWQKPEELEYDQYTADFSGCFHDLRASAFGPADPASGPGIVPHPAGPDALAVLDGGRTLDLHAGAMPPTAAEFAASLALGSYVASQQLAIHLLEAGALGILYPSARRPGGTCIACFRPSLVSNVRKGDLFCLRWYPDRAATFVRSPRTPLTADAPAAASR